VSAAPIPPFQRFLDAQREVVWRYLVATVGAGDAEDCFQETFVAALRAYPRLRADSDVRAWVLTIAHRKALDALRARSRRARPIGDAGDVERSGAGAAPDRRTRGAGGASAVAAIADAPAATPDEELWRAVGALPPRQRSAVVLRFVADLRHREIASAIGCSEDAARRSLHEGLTKLREAVET
jgi:RNA polymerase sigma factor (sigma-70 family)